MRRFLLAVVIGTAYVFTIISVYTSCRFWEATSEEGMASAAGLFSFSYRHDQCVKFLDIPGDYRHLVDLDASMKAAQVFGVFASIFGGVACLLTITGSCILSFFPISKRTWRTLLAGSLWGALFCQSLTFLTMIQVHDAENCDAPNVVCQLGFGGLCSVFACILYLLAAVAVSLLAFQPPKDNPGTTYLANLGTRFMKKSGISWKQHPLQSIRLKDIALILYTLATLLLSLAVFLDCRFFVVEFQNKTREYQEGISSYYYYPEGECRRFERGSKESFKAQTKAAAAFAIITIIFGGLLALLILAMVLVFNFPATVYKILPGLAILAAICQALVFLGNSERNDILCSEDIEDQSCKLGYDAYVAMVNIFLYVLVIPGLRWFIQNPNIDPLETTDEPLPEKEDPSPAASATDLPPPEVDTEKGDHMTEERASKAEESLKMD